jgi:hypothetical protein
MRQNRLGRSVTFRAKDILLASLHDTGTANHRVAGSAYGIRKDYLDSGPQP